MDDRERTPRWQPILRVTGAVVVGAALGVAYSFASRALGLIAQLT